MIFNRIFLIDEYRIIAPDHSLCAVMKGKLLKIFNDLMFIRDIWFNVFSIRSDRHIPELPEGIQFVDTIKGRTRILCAEYDHIHCLRIKFKAGHKTRIIGIADIQKTFMDSVAEP